MSVERCSTFGLILDSRPEVHHDSTEAAGVARWLVTDLHWCAAGRRYEDNGDNLTHLLVTVNKTDKNSIGGYGSPEKFLQDNSYLLGQQVFTGTPPPPFSPLHTTSHARRARTSVGLHMVLLANTRGSCPPTSRITSPLSVWQMWLQLPYRVLEIHATTAYVHLYKCATSQAVVDNGLFVTTKTYAINTVA